MKRILPAAFAMAAALVTAAPAAAKTIVITAEGEVGFGTDSLGFFGAAGADLSGEQFTYVATLDLTNATYTNSGFRTDFGGADGGGVITINGHSRVIDANGNATLTAIDGGGSDFDQQFVGSRNQAGSVVTLESVLMGETPSFGLFGPDYVPPSGNLCATHSCTMSNYIYSVYDGFNLQSAIYAGLDPTVLTISVVPEPADWLLMLLGSAGVGLALRRRRADRVVAV